jgi:hypothetical protein
MSSSSSTDREQVKRVLAETNARYSIVVHNEGCEILLYGYRSSPNMKHQAELRFDAAGYFYDATPAWKIPIFYVRVWLVLLGFGRC